MSRINEVMPFRTLVSCYDQRRSGINTILLIVDTSAVRLLQDSLPW